eukprot:TRINITY_DN540_c9_g1_i1.p1 TRINITY_DN540_c9_g1~~TRINITY_DN540_c9_g1_i1.p1  ORF type:complete len:311 (+),score=23.85 TRINITY_DN540_c9_g1_i1:63-995(+)
MDGGTKLVFLLVSPFSMVGSFFIIITFGTIPKLKKHGFHFVFFQAICDFIFTLKFFITATVDRPNWIARDAEIPGTIDCQFLGFINQFFAIATTSWNLMITIKTLITFYNPYLVGHINNIYFHLYVWSFTSLCSIIPAALNKLGPTSDGCWIIDSGSFLRLIFQVIPISLYFLLSILCLIYILYKLHFYQHSIMNGDNALRHKSFRFKTQLILYITIFIVCWTPIILFHFLSYIAEIFELRRKLCPTIEVVLAIEKVAAVGQGAANSIVWMSSNSFCQVLKDYAKKPQNQVEVGRVKNKREEIQLIQKKK